MSFDDYTHIEPYYHVPDSRLSESMSYVNESKTLLWVDIYKAQIHKVENIQDPQSSHKVIELSRTTYSPDARVPYPSFAPDDLKESVGVVFPNFTKNKPADEVHTVLFAARLGIGRADFTTGKWEYLLLYTKALEGHPTATHERLMRLRSNDGNITPDGRYIIVGLMHDFFEIVLADPVPLGLIMKIDMELGKAEVVWDGIWIPNAFSWDADMQHVYVTDSWNNCIWKCDYDQGFHPHGPSGVPKEHKDWRSSREMFIDIRRNNTANVHSPEPDGSYLDKKNNILYQCVWGTGRIQAYSFEKAAWVKDFKLPVPRLSSCCVVGNDIFVTSANEDVEHGSNPKALGGAIWRLENAAIGGGVLVSSREPLRNF